jgi:hypothetical protein
VKPVKILDVDLLPRKRGRPRSSMDLEDENFWDESDEIDFDEEEPNSIPDDNPHWTSVVAREEAKDIIREAMQRGGPGSKNPSGITPFQFATMLSSCCSLELVNIFLDNLVTDPEAKEAIRRVWSKEVTVEEPLEYIQALVTGKLA